jgi:hypothetical protein
MDQHLKQCRVCGKEFPGDTGFYAGTGKICKECYKLKVRKNRAENVDHYRDYDRERYHADPDRKEYTRSKYKDWVARNPGVTTKTTREWRARNPEKYKAQNAVNNAIRDGKLIRKGCEVCGDKAHAHHEDYSRPLDVVWLCPIHHGERHASTRDFTQWSRHHKT